MKVADRILIEIERHRDVFTLEEIRQLRRALPLTPRQRSNRCDHGSSPRSCRECRAAAKEIIPGGSL